MLHNVTIYSSTMDPMEYDSHRFRRFFNICLFPRRSHVVLETQRAVSPQPFLMDRFRFVLYIAIG